MKGISKSTLQRLPTYLTYLKSLPAGSPSNISATSIAAALGMGDVQVRKDLASVSDAGKPKTGYIMSDLTRELEKYLGYDNVNDAVIVGAGKLGKAILEYEGFSEYGLNIVAGFDIDESKEGKTNTGKQIFHLSKFENICARMNIKIGIITVTAECAQSVCDLMVISGIQAILNFAPVHLTVTENVILQNENIAASLAILANNLKEQINKSNV
jgi:redox-sensing transcriptional repressor